MATNFFFNFDISDVNADVLSNDKGQKVHKILEVNEKKADFVVPNEKELQMIFSKCFVTQSVQLLGSKVSASIRLRHLATTFVEGLIQTMSGYSCGATHEALTSNTDLIPSIYEGGMKIWECSIDLATYLHKSFLDNDIIFSGKKILELGCGAGLPGIYAWMNGADVYFQDYNQEVLKLFTIPNLILNGSLEELRGDVMGIAAALEKMEHCKFISGSWSSTLSLLKQESFDFILTSETIYNAAAFSSLYELMKYCLKPLGVGFVAAKSYYFGVGGGTDQFIKFVRNDGAFDICKVAKFLDGVKREILMMKKHEN